MVISAAYLPQPVYQPPSQGAPHGFGNSARSEGTWACSCGFMNSNVNEVCGGIGRLGCKAPRPPPGQKPRVNTWICPCGFVNKAMNMKCGGTGDLGCNRVRKRKFETPPSGANWETYSAYNDPAAAYSQNFSQYYPSYGGSSQGGNFGSQSGNPYQAQTSYQSMPSGGNPYDNLGGTFGYQPPRKKPSNFYSKGTTRTKGWTCAQCGFNNKAENTVCGGSGHLGCKTPQPQKWQCSCGFLNNPNNLTCGGSGHLGCKAAKPLQAF